MLELELNKNLKLGIRWLGIYKMWKWKKVFLRLKSKWACFLTFSSSTRFFVSFVFSPNPPSSATNKFQAWVNTQLADRVVLTTNSQAYFTMLKFHFLLCRIVGNRIFINLPQNLWRKVMCYFRTIEINNNNETENN